ncbi:MAG TPA: MaoC/PaaZ C-terminal domain-containing protein [Candidatus Binataceae bacterium]|jgi:acyl dehydratase|nr:MaoC/PaaZ C-terminal domain-containing protein [Candidatus Binataceae bacterium]
MPLNKDLIGKEYPATTTEATLDAMQSYARAYNEDNPVFLDSKRAGGVVAPPMYAIVMIWSSIMGVVGDTDLKVDVVRLLHGEQDMEFLAPIRPGDRITSIAKVASIETKATGETLVLEINAKNQKGQVVNRSLFNAFIRGGGKGGSEARVAEPERGEPIATIAQQIDKDQTYRYKEASGDFNPIHVDENFAKMAGLPGIIVHGLCTMAFTSKVMIDKLCGGDPLKLKRLRVRFTRPVFPGQIITTKVWPDGEGDGRKIYVFETFNPNGQAVIRGGIAEVAR